MSELEQLAYLSTIVQAVLVVVSLVLILLQLRQNAKLAKASNAQSLVEHAAAFNSLLIQNPDLAGLWYGHGKEFNDRVSRLRYREMLVQWLIFHENIYYQHMGKLLDEKIYNSWREDLKFVVQNHNLDIVTADIEKFFPGGFGQHILRLKREPPNPTFEGELLSQPSVETE